jgi:hypothetical protein
LEEEEKESGRKTERDDLQKITVSAAVKLIPNPPALVERQKTNISGLIVSSSLSVIPHKVHAESSRRGKKKESSADCYAVPPHSLCLPSSNHIPPLINGATTIQPQILVLPINKVFFRQIHHPSHLEIKKYTMSTIFQFPQ